MQVPVLLINKEVELVTELPIADKLVVNEDLEGVVQAEDDSIQMRALVVLGVDVLLGEEISILLVGVEDNVRLLVGVSTDIRPKPDRVGRVAAKLGCRKLIPTQKQLDTGAATVNLLLVLDGIPVCLRWPLSALAVEIPPYGSNLYATPLAAIKQ